MADKDYEWVPLSEDEKSWLMTAYSTKLRYLRFAFIGTVIILTLVSFSGFGFFLQAFINDIFLGGRETWLVDQHFLSGWWIKLIISMALSFIVCWLSYYNTIRPFKLDAQLGVKQKVPFKVIRKEYFPVTDQYFIALDNGRRFETDNDGFNGAVEGEKIFLFRTMKSKYIFTPDDKIRIFTV